jgi:hypothetical protein
MIVASEVDSMYSIMHNKGMLKTRKALWGFEKVYKGFYLIS